MYFTKVELHNFGIYKGTHEMCLTDQIGNRNITLIGGLNGRGKTTFHDSILIALYGKQALKYIQEKARSYDKLLLDHINKHATDNETYVAVSLCLDDGTPLRVKRSWTAKGKRIEQQTIHVKYKSFYIHPRTLCLFQVHPSDNLQLLLIYVRPPSSLRIHPRWIPY